MDRVQRVLEKFLFPKGWVTLLSVPLAAAGLVYVFAGGGQEHWTAYIAYVFSACSLTWVCAGIARGAGHWHQAGQDFVNNTPLVRRFLTDKTFNMHVSLYRSLGLNVFYAVTKLGLGIYYRSAWFITLGVYYFLLAAARFGLLRYARGHAFGENMAAEWKRFRRCGWLLLVLNLALTGMTILVVAENQGFTYAGYLIYIMAVYAFYNVTMAVRNVIKYRRYQSPVMSAVKILQLTAALVSMLALETAMLSQFGGNDTERFRRIMTGCTGAGVCAIVLAMALYMIISSTGKLRALKREEMA